jgi:uncharacterized protein with PIN domain
MYRFNEHPAVKDAIEALGIPHTEVDVILACGQSVAFDYQLQPDDQIKVFPHGWPVRVDPVIRLLPEISEPPCFILDVHLGKLARRLRLLGFDCLYRNDYEDHELVRIACAENRIILTRDRGLLKRRAVRAGCLLNSGRLPVQLEVLKERYGLIKWGKPLGRCPVCNGVLHPVDKQQIADRLQPNTGLCHETFQLCPDCGQIYWRGSHTAKILPWIEAFLQKGSSSG